MDYSELTLDERVQQGVAGAGYVTCTPVQEQVLSVALDGSDVYVQSQTGTGKTAAYLVTVFQELLTAPEKQGKKALVMVPTRELAVQVEEEANRLGAHTGLVCASFYGGVGYDKQVAALKKGVDVIIGTPGRVIDLQESKQMDLSGIAVLVLDEADRMFDMGFYPDLRRLFAVLPSSESRQTMLFSATLNSYVKNLAWEYTRDAKEITIAAENITVDEIDQELIHVSSDEKTALLVGILSREQPASAIIFCNTKRMCEVLSKRLALNGIESEFIIGDLPQSKRLKIMDRFKAGQVRCLVATDVAARGIDVSDLAMVVNFDLPNEAENYVHRIGRTARAGKSGKAYTFCSEQDVYSLVPIERYIEKQIPSRVAVSEDLGEDKSKGIYIRTEDWREDDARGGRDGRRGRGGSDGRRDSRRGSRGRDGRRPQGRDARSADFARDVRAAQSDLARLSTMSADERMKYYKEKYAHGTQPDGRSGRNARRDGTKPEQRRNGTVRVEGIRRGEQPRRSRNDVVPRTQRKR
ncbi:MAG: DEAD/DEAH box helicase, partial [Treponemataceae bacterium]|nr:DEAD/DEAH box helicase [Treponemataceae bacterium]